ncbi:cytochrome P450 [Hypoxylon sp. FL0890]|nr:cytochrome P450 [Hypoxylon sp. FL0890]
MSPIMLFTAAVSVAWLLWNLWGKVSPAKSLPGIPLVEFDGDNSRERYTSDVGSLLSKGYETHIRHGQPFCIRDFLNPDRPRVFLPVKYMEELRNAPQDKLSIAGIINNILELFSHMTARVMVGPELCEAWPAIAMRYVTCVLAAQAAIRKRYYPMLYWTAYYLNPEVAQVNKARHEAAELIRPVLEARQAAYAAHGAEAEKHDDFIQWIMDSYRANGKSVTPNETVQNIFVVMFASMHGTSFIALQSLFSLLGTPGALTEVREEIERVAKNELKGSPVWTRHALGELRTMDSFMKETLRMKPFQEATVQRFAMTSYTFKDGLHVPAGTVVSFPNLRYNTDPTRPLTPEADTFDGKRWLRRRAGFDTSKFQFASTAEDAFDWGAGLHACPGRFMAEITIKLIFICLLTKYDMKLPDGGLERPAESRRFMDLTPDTSTPVMVKDAHNIISS